MNGGIHSKSGTVRAQRGSTVVLYLRASRRADSPARSCTPCVRTIALTVCSLLFVSCPHHHNQRHSSTFAVNCSFEQTNVCLYLISPPVARGRRFGQTCTRPIAPYTTHPALLNREGDRKRTAVDDGQLPSKIIIIIGRGRQSTKAPSCDIRHSPSSDVNPPYHRLVIIRTRRSS